MSAEVSVREIRFTTAMPWLRLGQAWGCALAPQQVVLALAAVLVLSGIDGLLRVESAVPEFRSWANLKAAIPTAAGPLVEVMDRGRRFLESAPGGWRQGVAAAAAFVVWSAAGVALSRCTAIQFGRDENPSLKAAVASAVNRVGAATSAPLIPLGFSGVLCVLIALLAAPGWIPAFGWVWLGLTGPLLCVLGATAAFVGLAAPVLWPLMVAACAADDSDAFDAFSRAFSLVTSRVWSTLTLLGLCLLKGWLSAVLLSLLASATVAVAGWSVAWLGSEAVATWSSIQVEWWSHLAVRGVMASLFWTLATIVYLFLRELVDGVPVHRLAGYEESPRPRDPYPVVGLAAVSPSPSADGP
jgi:hypothetical protein